MSVDGFSVQARQVGVVLSQRARELLSPRAHNEMVRSGLVFGGNEWIAGPLLWRFERGYATGLGYATSQRRGKVGYDDADLTYDQIKQRLQGHNDPLVWTGRLRAAIIAGANVQATATHGEARGRIAFGRLSVRTPSGGYVAPPPLVIRTLLGGPSRRLPPHEIEIIRDGFLLYIRAILTGVTVPTAKPVFPPGTIMDRRAERHVARQAAISQAEQLHARIGERMRARYAATSARWERWRNTPGGSAPASSTLGRVQTLSERRASHRASSRGWYNRHRSSILWRRKLRRRGHPVRAGLRNPLFQGH